MKLSNGYRKVDEMHGLQIVEHAGIVPPERTPGAPTPEPPITKRSFPNVIDGGRPETKR
jgi:hypothetical protein